MTAQEKFRAQVRAQQIGYFIGQPQEYTKPISYVATTEGIFEVRQTAVGRFTAPVQNIPNLNINGGINPGVELQHSKLPYCFLRQFIGFARRVLELYDSEAYAEFRLNPETNEYVMLVPHQDVSGGQANPWKIDKRQANKVEELPYIQVMQIHSHPTFSGHFSGKDNHDDRTCWDAMIFGVIGNIDSDNPTHEFRINVGGTYVPLDLQDVFVNPMIDSQEIGDMSFPEEWLERVHPIAQQYTAREPIDQYPSLWQEPDALEPWDFKGPCADQSMADRILRIMEQTHSPDVARAMVGYLTIDLSEKEVDNLNQTLLQSGVDTGTMFFLGLMN